MKDLSVATLRRQIGESRERLGEHLDLYQIHSATLESGVLEDTAVLDEFARLRESGLLVGLSVSGPRQADTIRRALEIERDGQRLFATVQATWNLLERSAGEALDEAHQAGVQVIVKEALANGTLTERNDDGTIAPRLDALRAEGERLGMGIDAWRSRRRSPVRGPTWCSAAPPRSNNSARTSARSTARGAMHPRHGWMS